MLCSFQSSSLYFSILSLCQISLIMLTLMTSTISAGSCITKGVSATHPYMSYLLLFLCLSRKSVTFPVYGCFTQPGFNALHALLLGVIFDLLVFFTNTYRYLQIFPLPHPWLPSSLLSVSSKNTLYLLDHCIPSCYCCQGIAYPAPRNCLLYLSNAVFQAISQCNTYLSWMDCPTHNKYREINGKISMSFWSKQQVFTVSWCKSSPSL